METTNKPRILFWDLENVQEMRHIFHPGNPLRKRSAGFCSNLAYILVFGYMWLGEEPQYILPDMEEFKKIPHDINEIDKELCRKAVEILESADVVVTWYGSGHDYKFLTGRAAKHGIYLPQNLSHIDLYKVVSSQMTLHSNRMDVAAREFGCELKTPVSHALWPRCWIGDTSALREMAGYCAQDCSVLGQLYLKLLPLIKNHPHIGAITGEGRDACPNCGNQDRTKNGSATTKAGITYQRYKCVGCKHTYKGERVVN